MSGLVGYGSSDEEDEVQPERPAKIAKMSHPGPAPDGATDAPRSKNETESAQLEAQAQPNADSIPAPPPGPTALDTNSPSPTATPASAPLSPYTSERQRLRELTMPTLPNFHIPSSPPPPPTNSEEAATLASTTKKFERFLELKRNGVHFNQRLQKTASLRNPSLLPKLMEFAGIGVEESHASTLTGEVRVPTSWPEEWYVEGLVRGNERREKKRVKERERVEFVPAGAKSGSSSKAGTPKSGGEGRRSKFDKR